MNVTTRRHAGGFWAITSYFNPAGYKRKLVNYHAFRERLAVPLVTVEASFDGAFELRRGDADVLVQIRGGDVLWQKERLLNIASQAVPRACDKIAWLDCDVVFDHEDWAERASRALDRVALLHLFQERHNLPPDASLDELRAWDAPATSFSLVHKIATGEATPDHFMQNDSQLLLGSTSGLGWASRREVLDKHRFYDACIVGGGDRVMLCAALGKFDYTIRSQRMNSRRAEHYLAWARPFFQAVQGRVGCLPGRLFHLWHGALRDRHYTDRHLNLAEFDPFTDIAVGDSGCWRWSSDKGDLHASVRRYFESRNEDGNGRQ